MRILIDADACPVVALSERIARERGVPLELFCDTSHLIRSDYAAVRVIGAGRDAVDLALINACASGDVVITQDYGVAALALSKGAHALHQDGWEYTRDNIDALLLVRHESRKHRASGGRFKGPKKRTREQDAAFEAALRRILQN